MNLVEEVFFVTELAQEYYRLPPYLLLLIKEGRASPELCPNNSTVNIEIENYCCNYREIRLNTYAQKNPTPHQRHGVSSRKTADINSEMAKILILFAALVTLAVIAESYSLNNLEVPCHDCANETHIQIWRQDLDPKSLEIAVKCFAN
ncbi:jg7386 [Pararge aegeria aegeria]|uniref:Jg7386 protein n=1 Tax=Pararge aegeria aegeria TaxID=348720 RepID=A0A8S4QSS7_9NEOP|nr:jg7386 [Pararge aegeria aegeria]